MATHTLSEREQFFYDNAGYSWDRQSETEDQGRTRTADALAEAEEWFVKSGYEFWTDDDNDADWSWMDEEEKKLPHRVVYAVLADSDGRYLQSLGGIFDPDPEYLRVVRAELALEQMTVELALEQMTVEA